MICIQHMNLCHPLCKHNKHLPFGKRSSSCTGPSVWSNRQFPEITGKDNLTVFSYSRRVKSPEGRQQQRRADLRQFEIFRPGPVTIYTRLYQLGEPAIRSALSPQTVSVWLAFLMPFVYRYPSSSPRAHCTGNKSVPTLRNTRRHGPICTGPCPKALTECSPLDFWRLPICLTTLILPPLLTPPSRHTCSVTISKLSFLQPCLSPIPRPTPHMCMCVWVCVCVCVCHICVCVCL